MMDAIGWPHAGSKEDVTFLQEEVAKMMRFVESGMAKTYHGEEIPPIDFSIEIRSKKVENEESRLTVVITVALHGDEDVFWCQSPPLPKFRDAMHFQEVFCQMRLKVLEEATRKLKDLLDAKGWGA